MIQRIDLSSNSQSHQLQKASVLRTLPPRREPYWAAPLSRGRFVGLRKIDARRAAWIARFRNEAGKQKGRGEVRRLLASTRKSDREDRLAIIGSRFGDPSMTLGDLADYIQAQTQTRMTRIDRGPL
jgi:hypothetical protein